MESWRRQLYYQNQSFRHYGVSKLNGAKVGSGRYPLGSGENPRALRERRIKTAAEVGGGIIGGVSGAALGTAAMLGVSAATGGTTFFMWPLIGASLGTRIGSLKGSEAADKFIEKSKNKEVKELQKEVVHYLDSSTNNKNLSDDDVDKIIGELAETSQEKKPRLTNREKEKLDHYNGLYKDYTKRETTQKYATLAAMYALENSPYFKNLSKSEKEDVIKLYVYDDLDQGQYNSAFWYLVDKGYDPKQVQREFYKIADKLPDDEELVSKNYLFYDDVSYDGDLTKYRDFIRKNKGNIKVPKL